LIKLVVYILPLKNSYRVLGNSLVIVVITIYMKYNGKLPLETVGENTNLKILFYNLRIVFFVWC